MKLYVWGIARLLLCVALLVIGARLALFHDGPASLWSMLGLVSWTVGGTWLVLTIVNARTAPNE